MCDIQADLARARSVAEAAGEEASGLRVEADSLRKALRAMEGRLAEYQAKDTEVCVWVVAGGCGCVYTGRQGMRGPLPPPPHTRTHGHESVLVVGVTLVSSLCYTCMSCLSLQVVCFHTPIHIQVYLRIKAAMELAEEARLERDAATSTTAALRQQLEATQVRSWRADSSGSSRPRRTWIVCGAALPCV